MSDLIYVKESPWGNLGKTLETAPSSAGEIMARCGFDWKVDKEPMTTERHGQIKGYHAIFRTDEDYVFGAVNTAYPEMVQNEDMFNMIDYLLNEEISFVSAGACNHGALVFGCFKILESKSILDDEVEDYLLVINDHLKPDGKISILHTPIRVACCNAIQLAVSKNRCMYRVPCTADISANREIAQSVFNTADTNIVLNNKKAEKYASIKLSRDSIEAVLDEIFPMQMDNTGQMLDNKTNENMIVKRERFVSDCLGAPNLANYNGTAYQMWQALLDYHQHYFAKTDATYDLTKRMSRLDGFGIAAETHPAKKFLKMLPSLELAA